MKYEFINDYSKVSALEGRLTQLEQQHYTNTVFLLEAREVGATQTIEDMEFQNGLLEQQHKRLLREKNKLVDDLAKENPITEE